MVMKMKIIVPIMAKNKTEAAVQAAALRENPGADWVELRRAPLPAADWRAARAAAPAAGGARPRGFTPVGGNLNDCTRTI